MENCCKDEKRTKQALNKNNICLNLSKYLHADLIRNHRPWNNREEKVTYQIEKVKFEVITVKW